MTSFQSRIRKNAAQYKTRIRAAELMGELLAEGPNWQAPQVRAPGTASRSCSLVI
jgi:hypothetical protein